MKAINATKKIFIYLLAIVLLIYTGYPFLYMISTSFKTMNGFFLDPFSIIPENFTMENFLSVYEMGLGGYFINSIVITFLSVLLIIFIAALASYPLSRLNFRFKKALFILFIGGMMIPVHATLIPVFIMMNYMGTYDSLLGLLGPYIAFALPISIFIFTQFMEEIPEELVESAKIDGAGHWTIFTKIIFPNIKPAISTVVIYNAVRIWNEFIFALVLIQSQENMTLPLGLQKFYGEFSVNVPGLMSALTLASLPIIVIFIFSQEKVVKGLLGGAVKG